MNKTPHCPGRLRAAIQLKCKNKFPIQKVLFQPTMNFPSKVFRIRVDPKHGYKTVNKSSQRQSASHTAHGPEERYLFISKLASQGAEWLSASDEPPAGGRWRHCIAQDTRFYLKLWAVIWTHVIDRVSLAICRLNILQRYWLGRILPWRHFFIWWGKKILIY